MRSWTIIMCGLAIGLLLCAGCREDQSPKSPARPANSGKSDTGQKPPAPTLAKTTAPSAKPDPAGSAPKVVHVAVCLCDNKNQGIVPVPPGIGNGQDPKTNLYWSAMYGVKTFFKSSGNWTPLPCQKSDSPAVLERLVFRNRDKDLYVIADAYDGAKMKEALTDFFRYAAGARSDIAAVTEGGKTLRLSGGASADLICFVGHDGLMEMTLDDVPRNTGQKSPQAAVVLACKSRDFFGPLLQQAKCKPLVVTTGLMCPEAYTLEAIILSWAAGDDAASTTRKAAEVYAKYQKCNLAAAKKLFVTGY